MQFFFSACCSSLCVLFTLLCMSSCGGVFFSCSVKTLCSSAHIYYRIVQFYCQFVWNQHTVRAYPFSCVCAHTMRKQNNNNNSISEKKNPPTTCFYSESNHGRMAGLNIKVTHAYRDHFAVLLRRQSGLTSLSRQHPTHTHTHKEPNQQTVSTKKHRREKKHTQKKMIDVKEWKIA